MVVRFVVVLLASFWTLMGHATVAKNLYSFEQLVEEVSASPESADVKTGLQAVLVKVTGSKEILSHPDVLTAADDATALLSRFSFTPVEQVIETSQGDTFIAQRLTLEFDESAVNNLIVSAGDQPMGALRPSVLVWLAQSQRGLREFVSSNDPVAQQVQAQAQARGLPLTFPQLDEQDLAAMPLSDVWGFFGDSIQEASKRYRPNAILVGRLVSETNSQEWLLLQGDQTERLNYQGALSTQLPLLVDQVADTLLSPLRLTGFSYRMDKLDIVVEQVANFADYLEIIDYIRSIPSVTSLKAASLEVDTLTLQISLNGNLDQLERLIALESRLLSVERPDDDPNGVALNYRWQP